jgi:hypothetical protein
LAQHCPSPSPNIVTELAAVPLLLLQPYATAPACSQAPTSLNSVSDGSGRLWGFEGGRSCVFRAAAVSPSQPVSYTAVSWQAAPTCSGVPNARTSVSDDLGRLWSWQNGQSCAYRSFPPIPGARGAQTISWEAAPACKFPPTRENSVPDTMGRLWSWQNGVSCAFKGA